MMLNVFRLIIFILVNIYTGLLTYIPYALKVEEIHNACIQMIIKSAGYNLTVHDFRKYKYDAPIMVFQHNSYADGHILTAAVGRISFMINSDYRKLPVLSRIFEHFDYIYMNSKKKGNSEQIVEFLKNNPDKLLGIAPASSRASWDDRIGKFSTGAFVPMKPVTPVLIRYRNHQGTWFNRYGRGLGLKEFLIEIFGRKTRDVEVTILEEIPPSDCSTPREFADKVNKIMRDYDKKFPAFNLPMPSLSIKIQKKLINNLNILLGSQL